MKCYYIENAKKKNNNDENAKQMEYLSFLFLIPNQFEKKKK